jgi:hypothetical protein
MPTNNNNISLRKRLQRLVSGKDFAICCAIFIFSCLFYFHVYNLHETHLLLDGEDVWFQGDMPRITDNMTDRFAWGHNRLKVHPLLSFETYPPTYILMKLGLSDYEAIQLVSTAIAGLWSLTLYALLCVFGCRRIDAILLVMLAWSSAATLFWLPTPESYALGSISIMAALMAAMLASKHRLSPLAYIGMSAFTMSVTITNWMSGLLATFTTQPKRRAIMLTIAALALVTVLWLVEKQIFPAAGFFIGDDEEANYMYYPYFHRIYAVLVNIFSHSMITPDILTLPNTHIFGEGGFNWTMVSIQEASLGSATLQGKVATVLWAGLLGLGVGACLIANIPKAYKLTLGLTLLGQIGLHILYGEETFLYSLHFLPLLIGLAAFSFTGNLRPVAITLTLALIPLSMINNWQQFKKASDIAVSPRQDVLNHRELRPNDPWSIYNSHAILAIPGSAEGDKSYLEPGGSFSPKVGSFGLSIWLNDAQDALVASSDTLPSSQTQQSFNWSATGMPAITTQTPYYKNTASVQENQSWQYETHFFNPSTLDASMLIRSVGPAGGPIHSIRWEQQQLIINDTWAVTFNPQPQFVTLGLEGIDSWYGRNQRTAIKSDDGWAFARIQVDTSQPTIVNMQALKSLATYTLPTQAIGANIKLNLPDARFSESLNAQIAHMMMGLVNNETRPGDPTNYPLAWQRDGTYTLVALTKAGQLKKAKALAQEFAETDFFGGFGAEADAPGLAIWALNQVSSQLNDAHYDQWLWPHMQRKAQLIERMLTTTTQIDADFKGKVVPQLLGDPYKHLIADPAKDGLIIGIMDHHRPLLFVNAVSYLGLMEASDMATRLEKHEDAKHWQRLAKQLKSAWDKAFIPPHIDNERTYISALWPSWIATGVEPKLQSLLEQRWLTQHDTAQQLKQRPLWTYFQLAESHQWLYLGHPERAWSTLTWFWAHQSAPNLYSWWEGDGEENSFGIWQNVRGWVKPKGVNPHYWTAAEMALLQMDMLGYIDRRHDKNTLVIGGGIPQDWMSHDMDVERLKVGAYTIDWHWRNGTMHVVIDGHQPISVKLANTFPTDTKLTVTYQQD